ncbi:MAG: helix-turn-helix domain-containing protein [Candidatus Aenigmatarchaeota archaeon]
MKSFANAKYRDFTDVISSFQMSKSETAIYRLLLRSPMTIKEIIKRTHFSERTIRTYLKRMIEKNFVYKKPVITNHLKYVYYGNPEDSIADILIKKMMEFKRNSKAKGKS